MSYKVRIDSFEGPFDLLVYLIENARMSIYDIQVSEITGQYLDYLEEMKNLDINVATEFMVLASELIEIKSRMILPRASAEGEITIEDDPRSELVERLLEYKRFKRAAEILGEKSDLEAEVFEKPQEDISEYLDKPDEYLSLDLDHFAKAFELFLARKKKVEEVTRHYTRIERDRTTTESRISYIRDFVKNAFLGGRDKVNMKELIPHKKDRYDIVLTFASILQMMREKAVDAEQKTTYGDIMITGTGEVENE